MNIKTTKRITCGLGKLLDGHQRESNELEGFSEHCPQVVSGRFKRPTRALLTRPRDDRLRWNPHEKEREREREKEREREREREREGERERERRERERERERERRESYLK